MRCPKCNSRSMIADYDDVPGEKHRALLCVCCGKRVLLANPGAERVETPRLGAKIGRDVSVRE